MKEKILFWLLMILLITTVVLIWIWALSLSSGNEKDGVGIVGFITYIAILIVNRMWVSEREKRRINETTEKIMDAIMEFHKKTTITVEEGLGKTKNK